MSVFQTFFISLQKKCQRKKMKKKYIALLLLSAMGMQAHAQQITFGPLHSTDSPREDWILPGDTILQDGRKMIYSGKPMQNKNYKLPQAKGLSLTSKSGTSDDDTYHTEQADSNYYNNPISNLAPAFANNWGYGNYAWGLHKGLNFSVALSAFATFGKHAPHRGGFTQTINATYLTPITKDNKLWMALGGYVNNINYGGDNLHDGGVYGILGYRINEHWEAYVYGQLSIANNYYSFYGGHGPYGYGPYGYGRFGYGMYPGMWGPMGCGIMPGGYGMGTPGANVLGAGVRYTNKNFSIGINVEGAWYNNNTPTYYKKYDYPVPEPSGKYK